MRRFVLVAFLLAGCAGGAGPEGGPGARRPVIAQGESGQYLEFPTDTRAIGADVPLSPEEAWPRLIEAYRALELPVATVENDGMRLGNPNFTVRNRIGGLRAARAFDCGRGRGGAMVAELYPVHVSLHTRLAPAGAGGTRVETVLIGVAQDAGGNSTNAISCSSTGALERRIAERLGAPASH